jgi:hypothetical protein
MMHDYASEFSIGTSSRHAQNALGICYGEFSTVYTTFGIVPTLTQGREKRAFQEPWVSSGGAFLYPGWTGTRAIPTSRRCDSRDSKSVIRVLEFRPEAATCDNLVMKLFDQLLFYSDT